MYPATMFIVAAAAALAVRAEPPARRVDELPASVHLNESLSAAETLARARQLADRGDWESAARLLDEVAGEFGDTLVRGDDGVRFALIERVRREILTWPPEGRSVYQTVVDRAADAALARGLRDKDLPALLRALDRYFASSSGAQLGEVAAELALEDGEFALARRVYGMLFEEHAQRDSRGPYWRAMMAVADALAGDHAAVDAYLATGAQTPVRWVGRDLPVGELIAEILASYQLTSPAAGDAWPIFGGGPRRDGVGAWGVERFSVLWQWQEPVATAESGNRSIFEYGFAARGDERRRLAAHAVCANGQIVVQDAFHVRTLRVASGAPAWRFDGTPTGGGGLDALHDDEDAAPWYSPTLANRRVYAVLGGHLTPYYGTQAPTDHTAVVCLDAESGREIWRYTGEADELPRLTVEFDGSPLVRRSGVYVVERRRRSFGFEDCVLTALDLDDGAPVWRTHLGSASIGGFGERRPTMSISAAVDDSILVATNLGTIAAVAAHTGAVRWLRAYAGHISPLPAARLPWRHNPLIVDGDRLICSPHDYHGVLVLGRQTGVMLRQIPADDLGGAEYVIGARGGLLYTAGREVVAYDLERGERVWTAELPIDERLYGRGVLTDRAVLVPLEHSLGMFDRQSGQRTLKAWEGGHAGGNLLAVADRLLVVSPNRITAYADTAYVWEQLRGRMAAAPTEVEPVLDVTELALRTDRLPEGLQALAEAIRRAEPAGVTPVDSLGRRIFENHLVAAGQMASAGDAYPSDAVKRMYLAGLNWAASAGARLQCRAALATWLTTHDEPASAVDTWQAILADDAARDLTTGVPGEVPARRWCRQQIDRMIAAHGKGVYSRHELLATERLNAAQTAGDADGLRAVANEFPNAQAAPAALILLGDWQRAAGEYAAARSSYLRASNILDRSAATAAQAEICLRLADCARAENRLALAQAWIDRGEARWPNAQPALAGRTYTWTQYRTETVTPDSSPQRRAPIWSDAPSRAPVLHLSSEGGAQLLTLRPTTDAFDRFFAYADGGIRAYRPGDAAMLWAQPAVSARAPLLLRADSRHAVFATGFEVFSVAADDGTRTWSVGAEPAEVDSAGADHEDFPRQRYFLADGAQVLAVRPDGAAVSLDMATGEVRWSHKLMHAPGGALAAWEDRFVYPTSATPEPSACVCACATGRLLHVLTAPDSLPVLQVLAADAGPILLVTAGAVTAFDDDAAQVWSHAAAKRLSSGSVLIDIDGVYVSPDGQSLTKLALADGEPLWSVSADRLDRAGHFTLALVRHRVVVATADSINVFDPANGHRLSTLRLGEDQRIDRWEILADHLVGLRFENATTVAVILVDPGDSAGVAPASLRYAIPAGRADTVEIADDALIVSGGGAVVSFVGSSKTSTGRGAPHP